MVATRGMIACSCKQQIPPLRFAPVGMTTKGSGSSANSRSLHSASLGSE
jgi:hypothetical protein